MARGHQKAQSQAKTLEKTAKAKKQQGHSANEQKKAAQKALVHACVICKVCVVCLCACVASGAHVLHPVRSVQSQMPDPKTYKQHFENKHPKSELPEELKDVVA